MFGKIIFVVTVNYDIIGIQATGSLEKCGRTVFGIVSPTDDFETIKIGIVFVTRFLQYFPCLAVLVLGDSMVNGLEESKLSKTRHIRVQPILGGKAEDIQQNLKDLLHEDLEVVIIHVGTNNVTTDTAQMIVDKLITLKRNIEGSLPKCRVITSKLIVRTDNTKANTTIRNKNRLIKELQIQTVDNSNISERHLGKRGLHLNQEGNTVFASNLLHAIRNF